MSKGKKQPKDKTIGIYQDTYDRIQEARILYRKEQKLPKYPSIKQTIHYIVEKYIEEQEGG